VRELGDWIIYGGAVAGALAAIGLLLRYLVVRPLRSWIVLQTRPSTEAAVEAAEQLRPNGGPYQEPTRHLIEVTADGVRRMQERLDTLDQTASENRELANTALTLARETSERLDRHMLLTAEQVRDGLRDHVRSHHE
jgi:hypothetical protein